MLSLSNIDSLLITGANGFVGRSVYEKISSLDSTKLPKEIILLTRNGVDFEIPNNLADVTVIKQRELTKPWNLDLNCTHIINLAADGSRAPYSHEANDIFRSIGKNLLEFIESNTRISKVFHASSGACFGYKPLSPEQGPDNPKAGFISSRTEVEDMLIDASNSIGFDLSIGRLFTFSGNHLLKKNQYAITEFIRSALKTGKIQVAGNPGTVRSFMHQEAMAEWILQALVSPFSATDLQIGASEPVTIRELAEYVGQQTNTKVFYAEKVQPGDVYLPDNVATKTKLGLSEGLHWKLAVQEMINTFRMEIDVEH